MYIVITTSEYNPNHNVPPTTQVKMFDVVSHGKEADDYYRRHNEIAESSNGMYAVGVSISVRN